MKDLSDYYNKLLGVSLKLTSIDPNLVMNDHLHYQRNRIEEKVVHAMKHWGKTDYNSGILALRPDGYYFSINGQHHSDAAVRLGVSSVDYYVFDSTGWEQEKTVFDLFQKLQTELSTKEPNAEDIID